MGSTNTRRIIVLRHAKSDQYSDAPTDHARPLNPRGIRSAPEIGARLAELGWVPQVVVSSDAERTRQTWSKMKEALGGDPEVRFTRELYLAGPDEASVALRDLPDEIATVMVLGHNPGWEQLVYRLCGVRVSMTTCNAALLEVQASRWAEALASADWQLEAVLRPSQ